LTENGRLVASCGLEIAYHGLLHLLGEDGAELMAVFTHEMLESLDPIVEDVSDAYCLLGRGLLWARLTW
jgi:hypothetical protein